ncbi:MAG: ABC transporter transmembrane domain-containing protein [Spirochaetia bacterium]
MARESGIYIAVKVFIQTVRLFLSIFQFYVLAGFTEKIVRGQITTDMLTRIVVIISGLMTAKLVFTVLESRSSVVISSKIRRKIRDSIYAKILSLEMSYYSISGSASTAAGLSEGIESLQLYFDRFLPQLFYSLAAPIILFVFLLTLYPVSAVILIAVLPLIPVSIVLLTRIKTSSAKRPWY